MTIQGIDVRAARLVAAVAAIALLAGCATSKSPAQPRSEAVAPPTAQTQPPASVPTALAFHATTVDGTPFDGATLAGKPAVVWFWAPWCSICRAEAPTVKAAADTWAAEATFVGIGGLGDTASMRRFVTDAGIGSVPQLVDSDGSLWAGFDVVSQPALAFVHSNGHIDVVPGAMDATALN